MRTHRPKSRDLEAELAADLGMHAAEASRTGSAPAAPSALVLVAVAAFAIAVVITAILVWPHHPAVAHAHLVPPVMVPGSR
ncbi:MAG TPA: hypothetical protein VKU39_03810 [Streptosporangiaceae bacterium]|nr:hypothetical protein [Streptosporangiaceae bacterium]